MVNLNEFIGKYYSKELDVIYEFFETDEKLYLKYKNHDKIALETVQKDEFGNNDRTLYYFTRNSKNEIEKMLFSCDGSISEIEFVKQ